MSIEQKVRDEVDTWDISVIKINNQPAKYEKLVRPIYYGIGIAATEKGIELYKNNIVLNNSNIYLNLNLDQAIKEFKKNLIAYQYLMLKSGTKVANKLGIGNEKGHGRVYVNSILNRCGSSIGEIKRKKYLYIQEKSEFSIDDNEILNVLNKYILKYSKIIKPILFRNLIMQNSKKMATIFTGLAKETAQTEAAKKFILNMKEYENLQFYDAVEIFKTKYLKQLMLESKGNTRLAAEKSKITYTAFRKLLSERNISAVELKKQVRTM